MSDSQAGDRFDSEPACLDRETLCISSARPGVTLHNGDAGFTPTVQLHYTSPEANANELLCKLKARLPGLPTKDFWTELMEGITNLTGSQYALAVKRILSNDHDTPVEMPELGEAGQCLMATAFFYNDGTIHKEHVRDYKYFPYTGPCSHMKHDKVFIVPNQMAHFIGENVCKLFAFPVDTYIGVPLFSPKGECIGHFGAIWTEAAMKERKLSWGFVEMALHALEDITCKRLLDGESFKKEPAAIERFPSPPVIPTSVVTAAQSLKPYARSLSHELRTPMQGVVGMLDIMHATVSETLEIPMKPDVAKIFKMLRENIEMVQDSSRRAVEAADNVVHAADLDLQVPETPDQPGEDDNGRETGDYMSAGGAKTKGTGGERKRKREDYTQPPSKHLALAADNLPPRPLTPRTAAVRSAVRESSQITGLSRLHSGAPPKSELEFSQPVISAASKVTRVRDHIRTVLNECLRYGGRPESAIANDTINGEIIDVRICDSQGEASQKRIEWSVESAVPDEVMVDERDFTKLISVLVLNALKFTTKGQIRLTAHLSSKSKYLILNCLDTGTGIPAEFMPSLFKAFSQQDATITRQSEGLGLGLMVAKGIARRLGGDLICVRSETTGSNRGSEFELRVPLSPSEASSRHASPSRTPTPRTDDVHAPDMRRTASTRSVKFDRENGSRSPARNSSMADHLQAPPTSAPLSGELSPVRGSTVGDNNFRRSSIVRPLTFDKRLAMKYPLRFLIAEDNRLNRKLLVGMLGKLGYSTVHEAFDGAEAVRLMEGSHRGEGIGGPVDVILMDLWMPNMDGYEATEKILAMEKDYGGTRDDGKGVKVLAVTADVTEGTLERAKRVGMLGCMTKPYKLLDLERLIVEHCTSGATR